MCSIATFVNVRVHHDHGRPPRKNRALQAFVGAHLLRERLLGVDSVTKAAIASGVTRAAVHAALIILQSDDAALAAAVLSGRETLSRAAGKVHGRVKLIEAFRSAAPDDRAVLGSVIGPTVLFDTAISPAL